ncbi:long-chain-fatty-acid--CoA ligase [Effusibacillus dendaii]|uniref:Long-chain-fatty-acid--CoA ligase n=1 Tax=Effusibacillus dendaii TaxID=2743772 RepID=A0A7I8DA41_9BACL|nr:long-chain fatty acid--CoA ligase [Effusibacillus dendaii]BCJ86984.1 long-chain-fatty-acid--CoA ligase [Effusibacillus dendaii]
MSTRGTSSTFEETGMADLTVPLMLAQTSERYPDRKAIYFHGTEIDYKTLFFTVDRFAAALAEAGIGEGDRVAIMLPNCPHYVIAYYGILRAGAVVVQISPMSVPREVEHYVQDSGAKAIVVFAPLLPVVMNSSVADDLVKKIVVELPPVGTSYEGGAVNFESFVKSAAGPVPQPNTVSDDVAVLQYTGGTTGRAKGAMLTHRNVVANALQSSLLMVSEDVEQERILSVIPLFHVYAMTTTMNMGILTGSQLIMLPRFEIEEVLNTIKQTKPTLFPGVPTMYIAINAHPKAQEYGVDSIRVCISGSAPLPVEVIKEFEVKTKGTVIEGYGLSEASPVTHFNPIEKRKAGSIGKPIPFTEAKIVDLHDGVTELKPGEEGELVVRGPQVMKGYWNLPQETAETLKNGWLHTGDIAKMDDEGYYYIIDRKKDLILASGFNVYPRDVEEVLYQHPNVLEAVVVGVPDPYRGETVKAFVVPKPGTQLTEEEMNHFCRERLAAYKVPRLYEFRSELPKTAVGKILRRTLRDESQK